MANGGEGGFDHVDGAQGCPVDAGEVVDSQEFLPIPR